MRILLFHCKKYQSEVVSLSTRPNNIKPEKVKEKSQSCKNCIVAFITVEAGDKKEPCCASVCKEILAMSQRTKHSNLVIVPFAHLSNNLASTDDVLDILSCIEETLKAKPNYNVTRIHFGSDKALLLDVYGHAGNVGFREF